jgi:alkylated DNA repair dioxygenase AlkB
MKHLEPDLFGKSSEFPEGLRYQPELISPAEERELIRHFAGLDFKDFEFQGFRGKRRVVSFGWRYDFNGGGLQKTSDMPAFVLALRERAAAFAGLEPDDLQQVLFTEYRPGAAIGWHKDRSVFGGVVGVSLLSPCNFRLRRKRGQGWQRASITAEPRSAYLLRGPSRAEWEHSIPPLDALRYSVTFRSMAATD